MPQAGTVGVAGVVDHDVQPPEFGDGPLEERFELGLVRDVGGDGKRFAAEPPDHLRGLIDELLAAGGDDDVRAGARKPPREGHAQATRCARHERDLALQAEQVHEFRVQKAPSPLKSRRILHGGSLQAMLAVAPAAWAAQTMRLAGSRSGFSRSWRMMSSISSTVSDRRP